MLATGPGWNRKAEMGAIRNGCGGEEKATRMTSREKCGRKGRHFVFLMNVSKT